MQHPLRQAKHSAEEAAAVALASAGAADAAAAAALGINLTFIGLPGFRLRGIADGGDAGSDDGATGESESKAGE